MITSKKYILQQLEDNLEQEGFFWRLARPETFIDLLKIQAGKSSTTGINDQLALEVILITLKALINNRLGIKEYTSDYKKMNKELFEQQDPIRRQAENILSDSLLKLEDIPKISAEAEADPLHYFEVLNNIEKDNYSVAIFENILTTFLRYIRIKHS